MQSLWSSLSAALVSILISLAIFRFLSWFISLAIFLAVFFEQNQDFLFQQDIVAALIYFLNYFFDFSSDWWKNFSFFPCLKFLLHINKVTQEASGCIQYFWIIPYVPHRCCHEIMFPLMWFKLPLIWLSMNFTVFCICHHAVWRTDFNLEGGEHLNHCGCSSGCFFSFVSQV